MAPPTRRQSSKTERDTEKEHASQKGASKKANICAMAKKETDYWVCLLHKETLVSVQSPNGDELQPSLCKLRHPRSSSGSLFLISANCTKVFQLFNFKEKYRSWFIGNNVYSDGSLYLSTPMDPLFLVLQYLMAETKENKQRFMTLDQLVCDEEFPDCVKLLSLCDAAQLQLICDQKDIDDEIKVYRYSKDKTLGWLKTKTENLADALEAKKIQVSSRGSHSSIFVRSKASATPRESYLDFAHGIVSEFLCQDLEKELKEFLGINQESESKQESQEETEPPAKRAKVVGEIAPTDDYSLGMDLKKAKKPTKLTAAQKQLSKVDKSGMKSISSFFSPKS